MTRTGIKCFAFVGGTTAGEMMQHCAQECDWQCAALTTREQAYGAPDVAAGHQTDATSDSSVRQDCPTWAAPAFGTLQMFRWPKLAATAAPAFVATGTLTKFCKCEGCSRGREYYQQVRVGEVCLVPGSASILL